MQQVAQVCIHYMGFFKCKELESQSKVRHIEEIPYIANCSNELLGNNFLDLQGQLGSWEALALNFKHSNSNEEDNEARIGSMPNR